MGIFISKSIFTLWKSGHFLSSAVKNFKNSCKKPASFINIFRNQDSRVIFDYSYDCF